MTHEEFEAVLDAQIKRVQAVLVNKTAEYANDDQLNNFRKAAHLRNCSMAQAVLGMMVKHTVSIFDMVEGPNTFSEQTWDEKITDHIIWLVLLKASLTENAQNPLKE